jgi:hypothetical protein
MFTALNLVTGFGLVTMFTTNQHTSTPLIAAGVMVLGGIGLVFHALRTKQAVARPSVHLGGYRGES